MSYTLTQYLALVLAIATGYPIGMVLRSSDDRN